MRKVIMLAGLVLVAGVLAPAATLAKAGGTDRPIKVNSSGTDVVNRPLEGTTSGDVTVVLGAPLDITIDLTGVATSFGKYSVHIEADGEITGGEVVAAGTFTVAARGGHLSGDVTFSGPLPSGDFHRTTAHLTVTGGRGRFAHASGTMTSRNLVTPTCFSEASCPGLILETLEGKLKGHVHLGGSQG